MVKKINGLKVPNQQNFTRPWIEYILYDLCDISLRESFYNGLETTEPFSITFSFTFTCQWNWSENFSDECVDMSLFLLISFSILDILLISHSQSIVYVITLCKSVCIEETLSKSRTDGI